MISALGKASRVYVALIAALAMLLAACGTTDDPAVEPDADDTADTEPDADGDEDEAESAAAESDREWPEMTITYASSLAETSALNAGLQWWAEQLEERTNGAVTVDSHYAGSLIDAAELLPATGDGRVELAYVSGVINPDRWPLWHLQGVPFQTENPAGSMWAFYELYEEHEAYREEWERNNVHNLMQLALPPAIMGVNQPADDVADLQGRRVRMVGLGAAALTELGMETVATSPTELYESIQRDVVDGYGAFPFDIVHTAGLHEVAPYKYDLGIGHYAAASIAANRDWWEGLDPDLRDLMTELSEEYMRDHAIDTVIAAENEACDQILEEASIEIWDDEERDEISERAGDASMELWITEAVAAGYDEQQVVEFRDRYLELYEQYREESDYENGIRRCAGRT